MPRYHCENCNEPRDAAICPKCGADTQLLEGDASSPSLDQLVSRVSRKAAEAESAKASTPVALPRPAAPPRTAPPPPRIEPAPVSQSQPASTTSIVGLDELHGVLDGGSEAVIICGNSHSGKSEIVYGYIRANETYHGKAQNLTLRATLRTDDALGATNPQELWVQPIDGKRVFLDPSGEFYKLAPETRQREHLGEVTEDNFKFVQRAVSRLAGIVLVVDLTNVVDPRAQYPWRRQEEDLKFVLSALRWLRFDKEARSPSVGVSTNIANRVSNLPRLDKRVLVLFSKSDQLAKFTNQRPLDFARQRLKTLHGALMTHARPEDAAQVPLQAIGELLHR